MKKDFVMVKLTFNYLCHLSTNHYHMLWYVGVVVIFKNTY